VKFFGIKKPSQALRAMVDGLRDTLRISSGSAVEMGSSGDVKSGIMSGGAAHHAIFHLCGRIPFSDLPAGFRRPHHAWWVKVSKATKVDWGDIQQFACAMEHARQGTFDLLFRMFEVDVLRAEEFDGAYHLMDKNWSGQLGEVEKTIKKMEEAGL
jgi:hypothetical protein